MTDYSDLAYTLAGVRRNNPFDARRRFFLGMMQQGSDASAIQHPLQAAGRLAQALMGGYMAGQVDREEQAAVKKDKEDLAAAIAGIQKISDPAARAEAIAKVDGKLGLKIMGDMAVQEANQNRQQAGFNNVAATYGSPAPAATPQGGPGPSIAGIESGGRYDAVGPRNPDGDHAFGKYQVKGSNIGPWTQEILGRAMSPQEFLQSPQAQEAVFRAKFGQYRQQYGSDEAAARAWFAGPGGMNNPNARDVNGMTVAQYSQKFQGGMPPQGSVDMPGAPPPPNPATAGGPAVVAPPAIPDVPRPQPSPEIVAKHRALAQAGAYKTPGEMTAAIEAEVTREHQQARETAKMRYEQQSKLAEEARKPTEGQKAVDTAFGKDYAEWVAAGGSSDTQRQLVQLQEVVRNLNSGKTLTGPITGRLPDAVLSVTNPDAIATRNAVEEVVQRNLRLVLGAQFTAQEGENLIKRAYNPVLSEAENAKRVSRLLEQIRSAAETKADAARYYEQHGTLKGWHGQLPKMSDFNVEDRNAPSQDNLKKKYGLE